MALAHMENLGADLNKAKRNSELQAITKYLHHKIQKGPSDLMNSDQMFIRHDTVQWVVSIVHCTRDQLYVLHKGIHKFQKEI